MSDDMADAIVNFKQSTEYKCDKLGYLSAPDMRFMSLQPYFNHLSFISFVSVTQSSKSV